jgi:hypothetical protein
MGVDKKSSQRNIIKAAVGKCTHIKCITFLCVLSNVGLAPVNVVTQISLKNSIEVVV